MSSIRQLCITRALHRSCPRCGSRRIFKTRYTLHRNCPDCGLPLEHEDGWSTGAIPLNYSFTCMVWILPIALLFMFDVIGLIPAALLAGIGATMIPILTHPFSKALWVGIYYAVLPHELARNADDSAL